MNRAPRPRPPRGGAVPPRPEGESAPMKQRTLTILKPDTVARRNCGAVISRLEQEGFEILAGRMLRLSEEQAMAFYAVHKDKPFYR
ncbi:MAG: hypothetical protein B7Z68_12835, partial [Acidobacteria bacterium 21-70-11]